AVDIGSHQRVGAYRADGKRVQRPAGGPAGVLVPGRLAVAVRSREDVEVAVAVDIGRLRPEGKVGTGRDDVRHPRGAAATRVLVPGHAAIVEGGREHVEATVAIDVGGSRPVAALLARRHRVGRPRGAAAADVLVDDDVAVAHRRHQVEVAVTVDVA